MLHNLFVCLFVYIFVGLSKNLWQSCRPNQKKPGIWNLAHKNFLWMRCCIDLRIFDTHVFKVVYWHWKFFEGVPLTTKKFLYENLWRNRENTKKVFAVARDRSFLPWNFQGRRIKIVGANFISATDLQYRFLPKLRGLPQILSNC